MKKSVVAKSILTLSIVAGILFALVAFFCTAIDVVAKEEHYATLYD